MIEGILLILLTIGFFVVSYDDMKSEYVSIQKGIKKRIDTYRELEVDSNKKSEKIGDKVWEHVRRVLILTLGMGSDKAVRVFAVFSAFLSSLAMIILSGKVTIRIQVLSMLVLMLLPYGLLRLRLENIRIKSSREGEILITEILNNYRMNYYNMREAIEKSAIYIEEAPHSKRLLFNLSKGLNRAGTDEGIKHYTDEFRLSLNTSWGNILSDSIYMALTKGTKVDDSISDLSKTISNARKLDEFSKRQNNETKLILRFLVPIAYLGTVFGAIFFFDISLIDYIYYQFKTEVGLTWFLISTICYIVAILVNGFLKKTKLDF